MIFASKIDDNAVYYPGWGYFTSLESERKKIRGNGFTLTRRCWDQWIDRLQKASKDPI